MLTMEELDNRYQKLWESLTNDAFVLKVEDQEEFDKMQAMMISLSYEFDAAHPNKDIIAADLETMEELYSEFMKNYEV